VDAGHAAQRGLQMTLVLGDPEGKELFDGQEAVNCELLENAELELIKLLEAHDALNNVMLGTEPIRA
jgi:hypothetical protein